MCIKELKKPEGFTGITKEDNDPMRRWWTHHPTCTCDNCNIAKDFINKLNMFPKAFTKLISEHPVVKGNVSKESLDNIERDVSYIISSNIGIKIDKPNGLHVIDILM